MAHFYGDMQGNRGEVTRMGSKNSGIRTHVRGWDVGAKVYCFVNDQGQDVVTVYLTSGSNGYKPVKHIGDFTVADLERDL